MHEQNEILEDNLKTFVGEKFNYYQQKWQLKPGQLTGFNVAAFFLGVVWLIYRKMYLYAVIFLILIALDFWIETYYPLPEAFGMVINIAIATTFGILGNTFYKTHAYKKVQEISAANNATNLQAELSDKGGTNLAGAIAFGITVLAIIAYAVYFILTHV